MDAGVSGGRQAISRCRDGRRNRRAAGSAYGSTDEGAPGGSWKGDKICVVFDPATETSPILGREVLAGRSGRAP